MNRNVNNSTDLFAQVIEKERINIWTRNSQCSVEERNQMWNDRKRELAAMLGNSEEQQHQSSARPIKAPRFSDSNIDAIPRSIPAPGPSPSILSRSAPSSVPAPFSVNGSFGARPPPAPVSANTQALGHQRPHPVQTTRPPCCTCHLQADNPAASQPDCSPPSSTAPIFGGIEKDWNWPGSTVLGRNHPDIPTTSVPTTTSNDPAQRPNCFEGSAQDLATQSMAGFTEPISASATTVSREPTTCSAPSGGMTRAPCVAGPFEQGGLNTVNEESHFSNFPMFSSDQKVSLPCICPSLRNAGVSHRGISMGNDGLSHVPFSRSVSFPSSVLPSNPFAGSALQTSPTNVNDSSRFSFSLSQDGTGSEEGSRTPTQPPQSVPSVRVIAPKPSDDPSAPSLPGQSYPQNVNNIVSENESGRKVVAITRAPYVRHQTPKKTCSHCNDHPEGFRGEHELRRHIERAHSSRRKVWVCIDPTPEKNFLAHCQKCNSGKEYGVDYNAAAHLRRTHFNPKKPRGRGRGKVDEKRGGKGGGDYPPMEELRKYMQERFARPKVDDSNIDDDTSTQADNSPSMADEETLTRPNSAGFDDFGIQNPATDDHALCSAEPPYTYDQTAPDMSPFDTTTATSYIWEPTISEPFDPFQGLSVPTTSAASQDWGVMDGLVYTSPTLPSATLAPQNVPRFDLEDNEMFSPFHR